MKKTEKANLVETLHQEFAQTKHAFLVDFRGLKVAQIDELRRKVRDSKSRYQVIKNTLARRALQDTPLAPLSEHLKGVSGFAWNPDNPVALAKALTEFAKTNEAFKFKFAIVDGSPVAAAGIAAVAAMPTREELLSKLAFLLQSPMTRFVTVISAPRRDLAIVLGQVAKQREGTAV